MFVSTVSEPKSYEPAGSRAVTVSVVPIVIGLPPVAVLELAPLAAAPLDLLLFFLPAPQAASVTAATIATDTVRVVLLRDENAMSSPLRRTEPGVGSLR